MPSSKPILIAGAGLAGCLMAIEVARLGYRALVFEKRSEDENASTSRRSINLALAPCTVQSLYEVAGLACDLRTIVTPIQGRVLHPLAGRPVFQPYASAPDQATLLNPASGAVSVSRVGLNTLLRRVAAQNSKIEFRFRRAVIGCCPGWAELRTQDQQGNIHSDVGEVIIAADGTSSAIRRLLARRRLFKIREERASLTHAYKELIFPADGSLRGSALHIWPRAGFLMMALPNLDNIFRGAVFLPRVGQIGFASLRSAATARQFVEKHFPDAGFYVEDLARQIVSNPVSRLESVRCNPWHAGRTVLIGDACHTLYPFSGQGANLALEDCMHLRQCMEQFAPDWQCVFSEFANSRKPRVDHLWEATNALSALVLNALPQEGIFGDV